MPSRRTVLTAVAGGLAATAVGSRIAYAAPPPVVPDSHRPKSQFRGLWIATVVNLNWPSRAGLTPAEQQAELDAWYDMAVARRYNAVVLQVRSAAQVFYDSPLEPWSAYLTGTQGAYPGYDPLAYAVQEAHRRGLEFHAWFNPYQLVRAGQTHNTAPNHPSVTHPEWAVSYGGGKYFDPGNPDARRFVEDAILVAVEKYDIDAVHFDDYCYPYPIAGQIFDDSATYALYGDGMELGDWRRHNVDLLIQEMGVRIKQLKPWVKWGVAPFAIWKNQSTDPEGSATNGTESYSAIYADTREWVRQGWLDYIAPEVYWAESLAVAPYDAVTGWWAEQVAGRDISLYIGEAAYKIGDPAQPTWADPAEMSNHLAFDATLPQVQGNIYFSIPYVRDDPLGGMSAMEATWYSRPALIPPMPWIDGRAPKVPDSVQGGRAGGVPVISVKHGDHDIARYAIFRLPPTDRRLHADDPLLADATHLATVLPADASYGMSWTDPAPDPGGNTYAVVALDRLWNESTPATVTIG